VDSLSAQISQKKNRNSYLPRATTALTTSISVQLRALQKAGRHTKGRLGNCMESLVGNTQKGGREGIEGQEQKKYNNDESKMIIIKLQGKRDEIRH
jgi:hypothetical protein